VARPARSLGPWNSVWKRFDRLSKAGVFEAFFDALASMSSSAHLIQMFDSMIVRAHVSAAGAKGAGRASARSLARRLHHENPCKIGRLRRHHRLRPDWRRSLRRASFRHPARYRPRQSAPCGHLRQRLCQQGQSRSGEGVRHRSRHSAQGERTRQTSLLREHPL
jgi:hypothetical protein